MRCRLNGGGARLGELDAQLLQHAGDLVIDVLRAVVGMKPKNDERESIQQLPDDRKQVRLANFLARGDELELGHTVHRIDVIHPFHPVLVALMHAVDADIAGYAIGPGGAALADGYTGGACLGPVPTFVLVRLPAAKVIQMGDRNARQPLEAGIAEHQQCAFHQLLGGRTRQGAMQGIDLGQQGCVCGGKPAGEAVLGRTLMFRQLSIVPILPHQARHLLARQPGHALDIAQQHALVRPPMRGIAKPLEHTLDKPVSFRLGYAEGNILSSIQKRLNLYQSLQPCFFHVDHHALHHDRFRTSAVQTHPSLEIRVAFRLILYWNRLRVDMEMRTM